MDEIALQEMHQALAAKGYRGALEDVRELYVQAREATEWRLLHVRWETTLPAAQVKFLDRLRALLERHFEESYVSPFFYDVEKSTISFSGRKSGRGVRIEAISVQSEKGHLYALAKIDGDWRRTKNWYFDESRKRTRRS